MLSDLQELLSYQLSIHSLYEGLYRILVAALNDKTRGLTMEFSGTFARLDYICRELQYRDKHRQAYRQICGLRVRCMHLKQYTTQQLESYHDADVRALIEFLSELYQSPVPDSLQPHLQAEYQPLSEIQHEVISNVLRCIVAEVDDSAIRLTGPEGQEWVMHWQYTTLDGNIRSLSHLQVMLQAGSQLNLIRPWVQDDSICADYVIFEPDLLIDTSRIAHCFQAIGVTEWHYLIGLFDNAPISSAQLLGNLAGQMLDEEVYGADSDKVSTYAESLGRFFADNAMQVITCSEFLIPNLQQQFHNQAREQQLNIRRLVRQTFSEDRTIQLQKVVLEPTFFCEMLGLQGRMDLLQSDKHVLMEQKSGKMDEWRHTHKQDHFVQVLLYQAMLHYAYTAADGKSLSNDDIASYLLYSRYSDGLIKESPAPALIEKAFDIRNQIAYIQLLLSRGEGRKLIGNLTPEVFNTSQQTGRLWLEFVRPRLQEVLNTIHQASPLTQDYFYRMLTFEWREHILSKIGTSQKEASGFAALWNCSAAEKREAGDLMDGLNIMEIDENNELITLSISADDETILPNFRTGDTVVLYAYPRQSTPDARRDIVFRASIVWLRSESMQLRLRAPQRNTSLFYPDGDIQWAVEHDFMESSYNGIYRGLFSLLQATENRRSLLLGLREPKIDKSLNLSGDYGRFNDLVLRSKQAQDYFLLVGPPGTGKTSCGLVNILNETLNTSTETPTNVLLVSYTNRAVDEICSKLVGMELPFIRLGNELSCSEEYKKYLLPIRCKQYKTATEIRKMIQECRVVVSTTTSMSSNIALFELKQFDLCIIDEASQILEPQLLALLCAKHRDENAIRKFVMIGDHKQLPAVVQQSEEESEVREESLRQIGLYNCRESLFERLLRLNKDNEDLIYMLSRQGRMHHDVALFPNQAFYDGLLNEVPLVHQQRPIPYHTEQDDPWMQLLSSRRVSFVNVRKERNPKELGSDKVNVQEAEVIAQIVRASWQLYAENNLEFSPNDSIGVIVPYRHQISTIRKAIEPLGIPQLLDISIDTVERYQGSQRDIIIYGFTVSRPYQLDFLANNRFMENDHVIDRKLNVALTRAREIQIMLGDISLLRQDKVFGQLIDQSVVIEAVEI